MTKIYDDAFRKLKAAGKTDKQAFGLIQNRFEKFGIFKPGTQLLTEYGKKRNEMTEEERAIDRIAKKRPAYQYKYINGKAVLKNIYKSKNK